MNALKILLIISLITYLTFYETKFWMYYFFILIPYFFISQFMYFNNKHDTPKARTLISLWSHPSNPQINSMLKIETSKLHHFLMNISKKVGKNISIIDYVIYVYAKMMTKYPKINGNIIFGKFVSRDTSDISVAINTDDLKKTDVITLKNVDKLKIEEINCKIKECEENLKNDKDPIINRRNFLTKMFPTFLLSPIVRILSYLSICGLDLSFFGFPMYAFAPVIVTPLYDMDVEEGMLPIPRKEFIKKAFTNAGVQIGICKEFLKIVKEDDTFLEQKWIKISFTLDHRYLDGSLAGKIGNEIKNSLQNPSED